jgi:RNA polymerase sigma-70 factor, ECF subfamily
MGNFSNSACVLTLERVVNDDAQLIDDALAGNSSAFGRLVTRYQDRLYNTLVHVVGSTDEAYDVVQDAFVQAYLKLRSFQRNSAFYTWLYRIAFNLAISRRRRHKPTASIEQSRELTGGEPTSRDDAPGDPLDREERVHQVRAALANMTEEFRTVLVLREIDGCCYETIAEVLELPIGTVRSRLHRARLELREQLKEVFQEDLK